MNQTKNERKLKEPIMCLNNQLKVNKVESVKIYLNMQINLNGIFRLNSGN